jgi:hypothetical protein
LLKLADFAIDALISPHRPYYEKRVDHAGNPEAPGQGDVDECRTWSAAEQDG